MNIFLDHIPDAVVMGWKGNSGHASRILEGYLGILNAGTKFGETDGSLVMLVESKVLTGLLCRRSDEGCFHCKCGANPHSMYHTFVLGHDAYI